MKLSQVISGCPASLSNYDRRTEYSASRERPPATNQVLMSHRGPKPRNTSIEKCSSPDKTGGQLTERQSSNKKGLDDIAHARLKRKTETTINDQLSEVMNRAHYNETVSERF